MEEKVVGIDEGIDDDEVMAAGDAAMGVDIELTVKRVVDDVEGNGRSI